MQKLLTKPDINRKHYVFSVSSELDFLFPSSAVANVFTVTKQNNNNRFLFDINEFYHFDIQGLWKAQCISVEYLNEDCLDWDCY